MRWKIVRIEWIPRGTLIAMQHPTHRRYHKQSKAAIFSTMHSALPQRTFERNIIQCLHLRSGKITASQQHMHVESHSQSIHQSRMRAEYTRNMAIEVDTGGFKKGTACFGCYEREGDHVLLPCGHGRYCGVPRTHVPVAAGPRPLMPHVPRCAHTGGQVTAGYCHWS